METITREYYVSPEIAKLLKKAGFDWPTRYSYDLYLYSTEGEKRVIDGFASTFCNEHNGLASMPTLDVAQRWLREVKGICLDVDTHFNASGVWFSYVINIFDSDAKFGIHSNCLGAGCPFNTYEEAQEAGIKKALEILLEKGE